MLCREYVSGSNSKKLGKLAPRHLARSSIFDLAYSSAFPRIFPYSRGEPASDIPKPTNFQFNSLVRAELVLGCNKSKAAAALISQWENKFPLLHGSMCLQKQKGARRRLQFRCARTAQPRWHHHFIIQQNHLSPSSRQTHRAIPWKTKYSIIAQNCK
jgi:hypothetical protein